MLSFVRHHTTLLVLPHSLLKEVCFPFKGNVLHKIERVLHIIHLKINSNDKIDSTKQSLYILLIRKNAYFCLLECHQQPVSNKLNVLLH